MSDLIRRQAAIDTLQHIDISIIPYKKAREYADATISEIRNRLKKLPSVQSESKWIPVTERLPEKYGWYMCTLKDYRVNTYYWNNKGEWIDNGKKHFFELYNISSRYTGEDIIAEQEGSVYWTDWVIAWMPLPEPWKEGE